MDQMQPGWRDASQPFHNPPLSPEGVLQAQKTGARLADEGIRHIIASPFRRTIETASHIGRILGLNIKIEPGVGEWLHADWFSGQPVFPSVEELQKQHPEADIDLTYQSSGIGSPSKNGDMAEKNLHHAPCV